MIQQTFITDVAVYPGDGECPLTWPTISYNHYLCEGGRHYAYGSFNFFGGGLAVFPSSSPTTDFEIWAFGNMDQIYWPSWGGHVLKWDGTTGKFIGSGSFGWASGLNSLSSCKQDRNGTVWGTHNFDLIVDGYYLFAYDPTAANGVTVTGSYIATYFGGSTLSVFGPDMLTDTMLGVNSSTPANSLSVYRISTGAWVRDISIGAAPVDINWEIGGRAYVTCSNGLMVLIDVNTGRLLAQMSYAPYTGIYRTVYEPRYKRLLVSEATPDAADGSSTLRVKGFRPIPIAASMTSPVFLDRPQAGRRIRAATRAIGAMGEPIVGVKVTASLSTGNATLRSATQITDSNGYAFFEIDCISAGVPVLTVQGEVV